MNLLRMFLFLLLTIYLLGQSIAYSQPEDEECPDCPPKIEEPIKLGDMFVTAFHGGAVTITPTRTIIDIEKFNKSGSVDRVEDILMHLTGIDVMRGSTGADPQQMVMMRGFDDSRFTIAVDGRSITAPTAGADTYVDWSSLTTGDIEKVEIIRGAASALYENSQGGVINIITKKGGKRDTLIPKIILKSDYSSYDTYTGRISMDCGMGRLGYFLNYGYKDSDGYLRNNSYNGNDYSSRLTWDLPTEGNLTLSAKGSDLNMGYPVVNDPSRSDYDSDYPRVDEDADMIRKYRNISYPGGDSYKKKRTSHLDLFFQQPINKTTLTLQLFQTQGDEDSYSYELQADGTLKQKYSGGEEREEKHWGGKIRYQLNLWENNALIIGYDQRRMEVKSMEDTWQMHAGYFEDTWGVTPKISIISGLRYLYARELTYAYADPGTSRKYRHKIKTRLFLPKSTINYKFNPGTQVFVSVNRDYRIPGC